MKDSAMIEIKHDGDTWKIIGEGALRDGKVFCHLSSTTRGRQQRNGWVPLQICDWIAQEVILSAAMTKEEMERKVGALSLGKLGVPYQSTLYAPLTAPQRDALERLASGQSLRGFAHGVVINHLKMKGLIEDSDTITEIGRLVIKSHSSFSPSEASRYLNCPN